MYTLRRLSWIRALLLSCAMAMPCWDVEASSCRPWKALLTFTVVCCAVVSGQQGQKLRGEEVLAVEENYGFAGWQRTFSGEGDDARYLVYAKYDVVNDLLGGALGPLGGLNMTVASNTTVAANEVTTTVATSSSTTTTLLPVLTLFHRIGGTQGQEDPLHEKLAFILSMSLGIPFLFCGCWLTIPCCKRGWCGPKAERSSNKCICSAFWDGCWYYVCGCAFCCRFLPDWFDPDKTCSQYWDGYGCTPCCESCCGRIPMCCKQLFGCENCYATTTQDRVAQDVQASEGQGTQGDGTNGVHGGGNTHDHDDGHRDNVVDLVTQ